MSYYETSIPALRKEQIPESYCRANRVQLKDDQKRFFTLAIGTYTGNWLKIYQDSTTSLDVDKNEALRLANPGSKMRYWRIQAGMTQHELSEELGVAKNTVARWERGGSMSADTLEKCARSCGF